MNWMVILGAVIGSAVGAALMHAKYRKPLFGAILGACFGSAGLYLITRGPSEVLAVETVDQFRSDVLQAEEPVVVDFYADWCPPCRKLAPTIKSLAGEYKGRVRFVKVNVDKGPGLAQAFGIRGIPTVILFVNSNPVGRWSGCRPASFYRQQIDAVLANP